MRNSRPQPSLRAEDQPEYAHRRNLQALSNGADVTYESTMRTVAHEGGRQPKLPPRVTQKHPVGRWAAKSLHRLPPRKLRALPDDLLALRTTLQGYIRNESGGFFTS
jgi:hypothetical protein